MTGTIETERLRLRPLTTADAPAFYRFYSDPTVMRFIGKGDIVDSEKEALDSIEKHLSTHYQERDLGLWAVTLAADDTVLGHCGTLYWEIDGVCEYEIACLPGREYWGHGYATEAACATRDWGFRERSFSRMISLIYAANVSSQKVAERVGLSYERDVIVMGDVRVRMYGLANPDLRPGANHSACGSPDEHRTRF